MERVLVTGGSGFLGAHVLSALACGAPARSVVSASRRPREGGAPPPVAARSLDLEREGALTRLFGEVAPTACLSLAALSRTGECEREPDRARRVNELAPGVLAELCGAAGTRLVHVSTDLVFAGDAPPGGYREEQRPASRHVYGRTKAAGEQAVLSAFPGALVVRLPLLYGDSGGRGVGASDQLLAALAKGARPRLLADAWRTPLDVRDAAHALVECLERPDAGVLHVAGPERLSRYDLGRLVLAARGFDAERIERSIVRVARAELDLVPPQPRDVSLDARRARELLATPLRPASLALGAGAA